jgi:divalent metal cation (Fe/Co/Zn/Cd) transporter
MAEHDDSTATILFALGANAIIALAKGIVALITGSTSMVAEDIAAAVCLSLALFAVGTAMLTGNPLYDALGSFAIGVLLLIAAVFVGNKVKGLLVGQSAEPVLQEEVSRFLIDRVEISEVLNLITLQYGADVVLAVKVRMTENVSAPVMVEAINRCERALRAAFPQVRWLFFEPGIEK